MNILLLVNELRYTCGVTNHILHVASGLAANTKNKIFIITGGGNGVDRFESVDADITVNQNFRHDGRSTIYYLKAVTFLSGFIKRNNIDIVHSHSHYAANIASHASIINEAKRVQTNHGILDDRGMLKHFSADKYVAINEHIFEFIISNNIADYKDVRLIRCGIDVPEIMPVRNNKLIKVIAASRFTKEKAIDIYIEAVSMLPKEILEKAEFMLAGEGAEEQTLLNQIEFTGVNIKYLGSVRNLPEVLNETDILVYPSRSLREGFPAVITEAGSHNNLVITSNFRGHEYIISDEIDGLVFELDDAEMLSKKLSYVIKKFDGMKTMSKAFYEKVKKLFDKKLMIQELESLYEECLRK